MIENEERYGQEERWQEGRQRLLVPIGWLLRWLWKRFKFLPVVLAIVSSAHAIESKCPGGSAPDATWEKCIDFETTTSCTTGQEDACWVANGFDAGTSTDAHHWTIVTGTAPVLGTRYAKGLGAVGSNSSGFGNITLGNDNAQVTRVRFYMRTRGYRPTYYDNHIFGITANGNAACTCGGTFEGGAYAYYTYSTCSCATSDNYYPNQGVVPILYPDIWNRIELLYKMDTSCSDQNSSHGCNGVLKLWVNGTLVTSYTDINWGGVKSSATWETIKFPEDYYHRRYPSWGTAELDFDQLVITSDDTNLIGAVAGESVGTADTDGPWLTHCSLEAYYEDGGGASLPLGQDCSAFHCKDVSSWRSGTVTYDSGKNYGGYTSTCASPGTDGSFKVTVAGANGAGHQYDREGGTQAGGDGNSNAYRVFEFPTAFIHGRIWVDAANSYTDTIALAGWRGYTNTDDWGKYVALSISNGKWSIVERLDATFNQHESTTTATTGAWHQFEIGLWKNDGTTEQYSLMIDGVRIFDRQSLTQDASWYFGQTSASNGPVVGVIDYRGTGTQNFWYDNISLGSISFWSSDGWGSDSPFSQSTSSSIGNWLRFRLRHWRIRH